MYPIRAEGLDQRGKHSEEMMTMSNQATLNGADLTVAGARKSTNVAYADFAGAPSTLPELRAQVVTKHVVTRDARVKPKFLGMKADDIRRFTFV